MNHVVYLFRLVYGRNFVYSATRLYTTFWTLGPKLKMVCGHLYTMARQNWPKHWPNGPKLKNLVAHKNGHINVYNSKS
jgi:hypothetical protein